MADKRKLATPNNVQSFEEVPIDLSVYDGVYNRFLDITKNEARSSKYGDLDLAGAIEKTLSNPVFQNSFTEQEREDLVNNISFDYQQSAKEKLREEFPIIDQLVIEAKLKQQNEAGL